MDVRDMSCFEYEYFDTVIDKGTLDSLMCGDDAPLSATRMLGEVSRLIKPGGTCFLITYGDPKVRMHHLIPSAYNWNIFLYILQGVSKRFLPLFNWFEIARSEATTIFALSFLSISSWIQVHLHSISTQQTRCSTPQGIARKLSSPLKVSSLFELGVD
ncbi:hypothetical protein DY000_02056773 [Brassica cretica]|uniref:Methyltransferase type 11 domain-containing protein n=1 Tax=Brassica cretica TaxID=69181 RepID=A0ABQ7AD11_BRACR|nr:hypothetical protein DY000_02056773 [Brassica cretica]